jgi:hypothetical protein
MQVRVRRPNPLIERRHSEPEHTVLEDAPGALPAPPVRAPLSAAMAFESSEVGSTIYERLEQNEDELAEAAAELESALEQLPRDSGELPGAPPPHPPPQPPRTI